MIIIAIGAVAVAAIVVAIVKHKGLAGAVAAAKREALVIENLAVKVDSSIKADFAAVAARLRAI